MRCSFSQRTQIWLISTSLFWTRRTILLLIWPFKSKRMRLFQGLRCGLENKPIGEYINQLMLMGRGMMLISRLCSACYKTFHTFASVVVYENAVLEKRSMIYNAKTQSTNTMVCDLMTLKICPRMRECFKESMLNSSKMEDNLPE